MSDRNFSDRRGGLILFGILQIALGLLCGLFVLGLAAAIELTSRRGIATPPNAAPALVVYGAAAYYFITVGVGSIRARRWARAMSVAFSAAWLAAGLVVIGSAIVMMPRMLLFVRPSETAVAVASAIAALAVGFVILPLALFLFYRRESVRLTCELHDDRARWTDRVPWPVLAVATLLGLTSFVLLANVSSPAVPFFGIALTGASAALTMLALAGLFGFLTVQWIALKKSAWWATLLLHIAGGLVAIVTLATGDIGAVYAKLDVPQEQIDGLRLSALGHSPLLWIVLLAVWSLYLAALLRTRGYFEAPVPRTRASDVAIAA